MRWNAQVTVSVPLRDEGFETGLVPRHRGARLPLPDTTRRRRELSGFRKREKCGPGSRPSLDINVTPLSRSFWQRHLRPPLSRSLVFLHNAYHCASRYASLLQMCVRITILCCRRFVLFSATGNSLKADARWGLIVATRMPENEISPTSLLRTSYSRELRVNRPNDCHSFEQKRKRCRKGKSAFPYFQNV